METMILNDDNQIKEAHALNKQKSMKRDEIRAELDKTSSELMTNIMSNRGINAETLNFFGNIRLSTLN